jgi:hypothetical protein
MERLETTPAANRGSNKAYIKQQLNYRRFNLLGQSEDVKEGRYGY